ncbi:hypothetical protein K466DRAFT_557273 [Polyporus arcularius HHB13444]|uniref:Protein LCHN n=1 Tax=Polyporus arcularius HHB13444 TaxID=1314778 RepID=A0A5C3NX37_9APHY|nr:hypothetical protein K466DRAFT_557273 [Polyporus arcularius HHB13444]
MLSSDDRTPQDLIAIFHTSFHRTQGNVIDWSLKISEDLDLSNVEFSCLPSGLHEVERDVVYFTKDDHHGVCVFRRRRTSEDGHRGFRLSSLGILLAKSPRARPWRHVAALKELVNDIYTSMEDRDTLEPLESDWEPARMFFEERKVRDDSSSGTWEGWGSELEGSRSDCAPTTHLPHLLRILGPSSLTLYKHILGRRRVLIITRPPVEAACILCHVAADTCYEEQISALVSAYDFDEGDDEPPPRLQGKSTAPLKVLGMVTLNDLDKLDFESKSGRGWIACTTDSIFLDKPSYYDLLIDLRSTTPNTRPAFYVPKPIEQPNGWGPSHRLSGVRFTWSDVRLWSELERLLQLDSEDSLDPCCDPSHSCGKPRSSTSSAWTDVWRVYEDVCVMCAGLWMGAWRNSTPSYPGPPRRAENWGSIRLEGDDDLTKTRSQSYVRTLGSGIEGRPSGSTVANGRASRALRRPSAMSAWTWAGGKSDTRVTTEEVPAPSAGMYIPGERGNPPERASGSDNGADARRDRQVMTTLALLQVFHTNTASILSRLATLLETRKSQYPSRVPEGERGNSSAARLVLLTPKDVMSFELGPFSGLDARFVEWLGEEYGGGAQVLVKRGWKDLVGLILGLG